MKKILLIVFGLIFFGGDAQTGISRNIDESAQETYYKNGQLKAKKFFKNEKLNGTCRIWYENGRLKFEGNFKNGRKQGKHLWWYENGQLEYEEYYNHGQKEGVWKGWWENGQLEYEGQFKHNKRDDVWRSYYENNQVQKETTFILERKVLEKCFAENGDKIRCEEALEPIWWWRQETCLDEHGNIIDCDAFYLGVF
tara:strand:- start:635 stop:1222 length:588 start_codon:yes stop_codon:yes gene_type:complete